MAEVIDTFVLYVGKYLCITIIPVSLAKRKKYEKKGGPPWMTTFLS